MQLDLMNNEFYVFTNSTTMEMNVIFRRKDGNFGHIARPSVTLVRVALIRRVVPRDRSRLLIFGGHSQRTVCA